MNKKNKAQKVYVICVDSECSSNIVSAVYLSREEAENWVEKENEALKFKLYRIEQSQLIK